MITPLEDQLAEYGAAIDDAIDRRIERSRLDEHASPQGTSRQRPAPRSRRALLGVAAAAALAMTGGAIAMWPGSSSPAWADWTPIAQPISADEVGVIDSFCRAATSVDGMEPLIVDARGSGAMAIYGDGTGWVTCHAQRESDDGFRLVATTMNRGDDLSAARTAVEAGAPVAVISLGWQGDPPASVTWGVRAASVDSIEIATVDGVVTASANEDIWVGWWPTDDAATARVRALDASGAALVGGVAGELATPLPDPSTIAADVATDGTELERAVLADGVVTWPEFVTALDAWQACVAEDGYELTIEIDKASQTYRAISPTVNVASPAGEPDDAAAKQLLEPIEASILECMRLHLSRIERIFVQQ